MKEVVLYISHIINQESISRYRLLEKSARRMKKDIVWVFDKSGKRKVNVNIDDIDFCKIDFFEFDFDKAIEDMPFIYYKLENYDQWTRKYRNSVNAAVMQFYRNNLFKYDYMWIVEYDACFTGDWVDFFGQYVDDKSDLIAFRYQEMTHDIKNEWWWHFMPGRIDQDFLQMMKTKFPLCQTLNCICRVSFDLLYDILKFYHDNDNGGCFYEWVWATVAKMKGKTIRNIQSNFFQVQKIPEDFNDYRRNTPYHAVKLDVNWNEFMERKFGMQYVKYWMGKYNLGDSFSDYLIEKLYSKEKLNQMDGRRTMMFIGSEIPHWCNKDTLCCGLGWQYRPECEAHLNPDNVNPDNFLYTRGKISRQRVIDSGVGISPDLPVGDSGILASLLFKPTTKKTTDIGIITHWSGEKNHDKYIELARKMYPDKNIQIMTMGDKSKNVEDLFNFINSCKVVVASSLHAIIFSHSFEVPAIFFKEQDTYKYYDYYSVYDRIHYDLDSKNSIQDALNRVYETNFLRDVNPTPEEVKSVQNVVLNALPYRDCLSVLGMELLPESSIIKAMLVQNKDQDVLLHSSSGGVIPEIMDYVLAQGGLCLGVDFDDGFEKLKYVEVSDQNKTRVMGSKYVDVMLSQELKDKMLKFLNDGKKVLFVGRPCQCHWLRTKFTHSPNLILVELMCHGVPEDSLWEDYIRSLIKEHGQIKSINFRDKSIGWKQSGMRIEFMSGKVLLEQHNQNAYMRNYLSDKYLKKKCANCAFGSKIKSLSDIICGDAWGHSTIMMDNDKGTSIVMVNSKVGEDIMKSLEQKFNRFDIDQEQLCKLENCNAGLCKILKGQK